MLDFILGLHVVALSVALGSLRFVYAFPALGFALPALVYRVIILFSLRYLGFKQLRFGASLRTPYTQTTALNLSRTGYG